MSTTICTLALIKSGGMAHGHSEQILGRATSVGLPLVKRRLVQPHSFDWATFYGEHQGRPYYERLIGSVSTPPGSLAAALEGSSAVAVWRSLLGPTDPRAAPTGTIRADFGRELPDNAAHGLDSDESAAREIALIFPGHF